MGLEKKLSSLDLFEDEPGEPTTALVDVIIRNSDAVFLKKLALNDWQWTEDPEKHQGGPYIFKEDRDSGFFFPLGLKPRPPGAPEIRETFFPIYWPALGSHFVQVARLVNYRSKNEETHLTGVPALEFSGLTPASFLLIGKKGEGNDAKFSALTVDSSSAAYTYLEDQFDIPPYFRSGIFEPIKVIKTLQARLFEFINEALVAYRAGGFDEFAFKHLAIPKPSELAQLARNEFQEMYRNKDFNPFSLRYPGDAVRELSRGIEYELFKEFEVRRRSTELVQVILGNDPSAMNVEQALINIIAEYPRIDSILLSASQTRKSRAGASFELHIERLLVDGGIPHEVQAVVEAKKRPDFVLPSFAAYVNPYRSKAEALVLSAKTTLRERWKQVHQEIRNCDLYLATVDENIALNAIEDMERQGITLVVPESLKASDTTVYRKAVNVISFKHFFENDILHDRGGYWPIGGA